MKAYGQALFAGVGGVGAAIASALCCAGPLLAIVAGFSGAGLAARFDPLRPWFLGATAAFLLLGFWTVYREDRKACEPGRACADERTRRRMKIALWLATAAALLFATFPSWQQLVLSDAASEPTRTVPDAARPVVEDDPSVGPYRTIALEVTGMTCTSCATAARVAAQRVDGVRDAEFAYPEGTGVVTYDTTITSDSVIVAGIRRATGYGVTVLDGDAQAPTP